MVLESGELDTQMAFEIRSTKIVSGEIEDVWADIGSFWGKLTVLTNRNVDIGRGFAATVNYSALIRYRTEVTTDCRAKIKGRTYNISGVVQDPLKDWTQLYLTELA